MKWNIILKRQGKFFIQVNYRTHIKVLLHKHFFWVVVIFAGNSALSLQLSQSLIQADFHDGDNFGPEKISTQKITDGKLYWKNNGSCRFVDTSWYSKCCKTTTNCLHSHNNITHYHTCIILVIFSSQTNFAVIRTLHHSGPLTFNWVLPTSCDSDHTLIDCLTYLPPRKNILCTSSCL